MREICLIIDTREVGLNDFLCFMVQFNHATLPRTLRPASKWVPSKPIYHTGAVLAGQTEAIRSLFRTVARANADGSLLVDPRLV